jgi:preprotein translocase subunit SecG
MYMRKTIAILFLLTMVFSLFSAVMVNAAYERDRIECDPEEVGVFAAQRNCDAEGDPDEDLVLAHRRCLSHARVCNPAWTEEDLDLCKSIAEKTCVELSPLPKLPEREETIPIEDIESRGKTVEEIEEIKQEAAEEVLGEEPAPAPAPEPVPEPVAEPEEKKMGATTAIIIIIIIIVLIVLWYFLKPKKKAGKKKKKK